MLHLAGHNTGQLRLPLLRHPLRHPLENLHSDDDDDYHDKNKGEKGIKEDLGL